jgi:hypothetical protein
MTNIPKEELQKAFDELNGLIFSDGPGAVCGWVNDNRYIIDALFNQALASETPKLTVTEQVIVANTMTLQTLSTLLNIQAKEFINLRQLLSGEEINEPPKPIRSN